MNTGTSVARVLPRYFPNTLAPNLPGSVFSSSSTRVFFVARQTVCQQDAYRDWQEEIHDQCPSCQVVYGCRFCVVKPALAGQEGTNSCGEAQESGPDGTPGHFH